MAYNPYNPYRQQGGQGGLYGQLGAQGGGGGNYAYGGGMFGGGGTSQGANITPYSGLYEGVADPYGLNAGAMQGFNVGSLGLTGTEAINPIYGAGWQAFDEGNSVQVGENLWYNPASGQYYSAGGAGGPQTPWAGGVAPPPAEETPAAETPPADETAPPESLATTRPGRGGSQSAEAIGTQGGLYWGGQLQPDWATLSTWLTQHGLDPGQWAAGHPGQAEALGYQPPGGGGGGGGGASRQGRRGPQARAPGLGAQPGAGATPLSALRQQWQGQPRPGEYTGRY